MGAGRTATAGRTCSSTWSSRARATLARPKAIVEVIEAEGGWINAATGQERTSFQVRGLAGGLPLADGAVLADLLRRPTLDAAELEREKGVIGQEIAEAADTPDDRVFDLAQAQAYADQALGPPDPGRERDPSSRGARHPRGLARGALRRSQPRWWSPRPGPLTRPSCSRSSKARSAISKPRRSPSAAARGRALHRRRAGGVAQAGAGAPRVPPARRRRAQARMARAAHLRRDPRRRHGQPPVPGGAGEARPGLRRRRLRRELRGRRPARASTPATSAKDAARWPSSSRAEIRKLAERREPAELARARAQGRAQMAMAREQPLHRAEQAAAQVLLFDRSSPRRTGGGRSRRSTPPRCAPTASACSRHGPQRRGVLGPKARGRRGRGLRPGDGLTIERRDAPPPPETPPFKPPAMETPLEMLKRMGHATTRHSPQARALDLRLEHIDCRRSRADAPALRPPSWSAIRRRA